VKTCPSYTPLGYDCKAAREPHVADEPNATDVQTATRRDDPNSTGHAPPIPSSEMSGGVPGYVVLSAETGSEVNVDGGDDADTLVGPESENTWHITGLDAGDINTDIVFSDIENLKCGRVSNQFDIPLGGSISGEIEGGSTDDDLIFDDTANTTGGTYEISATEVTLPDGRQVSYEQMEYLEPNSSTNGVATINLTGNASVVQINTGNGDDDVNIETTNHTLGDLRAAVTGRGWRTRRVDHRRHGTHCTGRDDVHSLQHIRRW